VKPTLVAALAVGAVALSVGAVGCGDKSSTTASSASSAEHSSSKSASSSSSSAASSADKDYSGLLIAAEDITAPGDTFTAQAPTVNPAGKPGVATVFSNGPDTREIGDTIMILPDAGAAAEALHGATDALSGAIADPKPEPAQVGSDAIIASGTSPDGSKAVTVLLFVEGKAFTTLEFDSAAGDPVPSEFVLDVAGKQDQKIKTGLAG
jgi:hypothetical protein